MSDLQRVNDAVLPQAFNILPASMDSLPARAMMLATGLQESSFAARVQVGGPAHGYWQFEQGGGIVGVMGHPASKVYARRVCEFSGVAFSAPQVYASLVKDDALAAAFARLLLYTLPDALPRQNESDKGWVQYVSAWRPGMPRPHDWPANFALAWETVIGAGGAPDQSQKRDMPS